MVINFYKTNSLKNALNKSLDTIKEISLAKIKEDSSIINPTIIVDYNASLINANYVYIPSFHRYYFIEDITVMHSRLEIKCRCDVLMSFKNDILNATGTITRSSTPNSMIPDPLITNTVNRTTSFRKLGEGFTSSPSYILTIGG